MRDSRKIKRVEQDLFAFVRPAPTFDGLPPNLLKRGWGNGYVAIAPTHPMHGMGYDDIPVSISGGLTFGKLSESTDYFRLPPKYDGWWIVGFDTGHFGDNLETWPDKKSVMNEAKRLKEQLEKLRGE